MNAAEKQHSDASPSNADRWFDCPGSVRLLRELKAARKIHDTTSLDSARGTAAHALLEACLKSGKAPVAFKGKRFNDIAVDAEIMDAVEYALDYVEEIAQEFNVTARSEEYVQIWTLNPPGEIGEGGTLDVMVIGQSARVLHIFDFKNGTGPVSAERNKQMLLYAVGVQALSLYEYKTIVLHIIQPRSKDGQPSSRWEISADELAKFETESRGKFLATLDPKAPRVPGETQCKWCQAKPFCPEFMNKGLAVARTTFADFTTTKIRKGDNPPPLIGITWTAQTLRQAWDNLWILSDIAEVIKSSVLLALKKGGGELLGLKLVRGKSNRRWKDELEAMQYIARSAGRDLKPGAYAPRRMIGITEMEKLLAGMKMDKKARDKFLSPVVVKPPGAPTITPITDPRPAINAAAEDFKDI